LAAIINHFLMVYAIISAHDFLTNRIMIDFRIPKKAIYTYQIQLFMYHIDILLDAPNKHCSYTLLRNANIL